jgi:hypothetical protein
MLQPSQVEAFFFDQPTQNPTKNNIELKIES